MKPRELNEADVPWSLKRAVGLSVAVSLENIFVGFFDASAAATEKEEEDAKVS